MKRRIRITPSAMVGILLFLVAERSVWVCLAIGAAVLHEGGHLLAARFLRVEIRGIEINGFGVKILLGDGLLSYRDEALIAAAGPAVNLLCVFLLLPFLRRWPSADRLLFFASASFLLAVINLLPLRGFDGGRLLGCAFARFFGPVSAGRILRPIHAVCSVFVWCGAVSLYLVSRQNISLLVLSTLFLWRVIRENLCR